MTTFEDEKFNALSNIFKERMSDFAYKSKDERAWSILDNRQFEIMDAQVSNEKKAQAFDWVLNEITRIFPDSNTYYCQALARRLAYTEPKNNDALEIIAKDACMHSRNVKPEVYQKIVYDAYMASNNKKNFTYAKVAQKYRKDVIYEAEKKLINEELEQLKKLITDKTGTVTPENKINLIEKAIGKITEPPFKKTEAYKEKIKFCNQGVRVSREELFDTKKADEYILQISEYYRLIDNAYKHSKPFKANSGNSGGTNSY